MKFKKRILDVRVKANFSIMKKTIILTLRQTAVEFCLYCGRRHRTQGLFRFKNVRLKKKTNTLLPMAHVQNINLETKTELNVANKFVFKYVTYFY